MKRNLSKGKFIVFEGGEACGKSTQIKILQKNYPDFVYSREPGGTEVADQIRTIVTEGKKDKILPETELALIYAARFEHLHKVILPALDAGKNVICDRFFLSSFVYQGAARGLSNEFIENIHNLFLQNFTPDLTFIMDLEVDEAKKRVGGRGNKNERFEQFDRNFHQNIRMGFRNYGLNNPTAKIIDASKAISEISEIIKQEISLLVTD